MTVEGTSEARVVPQASSAQPPAGFVEDFAHVNGITVDYVRGGHGPTVVLLHGYPETWYEWKDVMPALAEHYTVIAPDLRGAGGSSAPTEGYDKTTMAEDLHALLVQLHLTHNINLVGHDIGTMVAYSYAAQHREDVAKLVLTEAPIPDQSLYQFPSLTSGGPGFWNFGFFNVTNGLPESMLEGREQTWINGFVSMLAVQKDRATDPVAIADYAHGLSDSAHLRASFEWFRTLNKDVADNQQYARKPLDMPVLALGAAGSLGQSVPDQVRKYASNVEGGVVADSGHWIFEEQPEVMTQTLLRFLAQR
ncbi:alpha/beta fold hydrolase [Amycolatopsis sp. FDAARGOS 1241]|uniref:alpha/beta fold hydrolase n=1 Tax=Amycolatopsis sp. FDAARGOS 1241 TaxID=2778070 RepID=UPI001951ACE9|nr:alpha/beta hydrolase [Amycolatopsis sp. FDAARGOS 1241]QRP47942.1 alpha/beta hydrolase [Amycolatopsis sp. FDAARGOS 1241]